MSKKDFYIFLDIDGVLFDWIYLKEQMDTGRLKKGGLIGFFDPKCINALNKLIQKLESNYDVTIVISSSWRRYMNKTEKALKDHGLKYDKPLESTPISKDPHERGLEIKEYLSTKNQPYDFVIIDDETFDFNLYFKKYQIIKTDVYQCSLNNKMVEDFLKNLKDISEKNVETNTL